MQQSKSGHRLGIFVIYFLTFVFLLYSLKFLIFLLLPRLYNFIAYIAVFPILPQEIDAKVIKDYPLVLTTLSFATLAIYVVSLTVIFLTYPRIRKWGLHVGVIIIIAALSFYFDPLRVNSFKFYNLIPKHANLRFYFISNFIAFQIICWLLVLLARKKLVLN